MPTRTFFKKGVAARAVVRPPKPEPVRPPDHFRKVVMAVRMRPTGTLEHKAMSSRTAARVLGGHKGGLASASLGTAYRWTTETARKAAIKSWTKRRKFNKRINARVGVCAATRPRLWREPLRAYYAENPTRGITYWPVLKVWAREDVGTRTTLPAQGGTHVFITKNMMGRIISERAALQALGHLKTVRGFIPDSVMVVRRKSDKD